MATVDLVAQARASSTGSPGQARNALLYHNSLSISASVAPDIDFKHHAFGVMVHDNVVIGPRVSMWHHVTLTVRGHVGAPAKLIIEEGVKIGAHAIVVTPIGKDLRIGRAARIGAGAIVTHDVPPGATVVNPPAQVLHSAPTSACNASTARSTPPALRTLPLAVRPRALGRRRQHYVPSPYDVAGGPGATPVAGQDPAAGCPPRTWCPTLCRR